MERARNGSRKWESVGSRASESKKWESNGSHSSEAGCSSVAGSFCSSVAASFCAGSTLATNIFFIVIGIIEIYLALFVR